MDINILDVINDSFSIYAATTIQNRAIVDVRDCVKPAQRQCMYAQYLENITYKKPFKKSNKSVAAALDHFYVHGDASCYALLTRMAKVFAMRYPLEDFDGSYGTISGGDTEAASRYTEMRLGELGCLLFENINKDCIDVWYDNYDNTEKFPSVLPTLGYYNICNGAMGIATSISTSIPQYNVREVNNALIKLLYNPDIDFEEIYCPPDFCTGATILNADIVKETHKNGCGKAAIIRSTIDYDSKENCLYCTEIPYGVYVGTICEQIAKGIEEGTLTGIKNVLDLSTKKANLKIILEKNTNVSKLIKKLYKVTSLQDCYPINLVMLKDGTTPKVFGWKEALQEHLNHEKKVYTKIHLFEIGKIEERLNIIEGLLIAIANIDEVVQIIRKSSNKAAARDSLIERFGFNEPQTDAILKMPLGKLINLEIQSFKDEKEKLLSEKERHQNILNNEELLKKEIEEGLRKVINKLGDERRTKLMNLDYKGEDGDVEVIEEKQLLIHYTNFNNIYTQETTTLLTSRRGTKGQKVKLGKNEVIVKTISDNNLSTLLAFSNSGKMYNISTSELPVDSKINISQLFSLDINEEITTIITQPLKSNNNYLIILTKNGMIKKSNAADYIQKRGKSCVAIKLKENDEVVNVFSTNDCNIGILSKCGNYICIDTTDIAAIGRIAMGIKAIKLNEDDYVTNAKVVGKEDKLMITVTKDGMVKKADLSEFPVGSRAIKGRKISDFKENNEVIGFLTLKEDSDIIISTKQKQIKFSTKDLRVLSRAALGVKAIDLAEKDNVIDLVIGG